MDRGPKGHINIRILKTIVSGIPLVLSPRTRMKDPFVLGVFGAPNGTYSPIATVKLGRELEHAHLSALVGAT